MFATHSPSGFRRPVLRRGWSRRWKPHDFNALGELITFDVTHGDTEERWFTRGLSRDGLLLAISHTYPVSGPGSAKVPLISARNANHRERDQHQNLPQWAKPISHSDPDEMPAEIDSRDPLNTFCGRDGG